MTRPTCWRNTPRRRRPEHGPSRPRRPSVRRSWAHPKETRSPTRLREEPSATGSSRSSRSPAEPVMTVHGRDRGQPVREAPRVRDLPAPRKNESAAGGAMQRVFAWPYRGILAFLLWTGVRPWQLTLLSLALNVVTGVLIVTGAWLAAGGVLILAGASDVFDGSVARHRGEAKRAGAFMDSVLDRVSDMILSETRSSTESMNAPARLASPRCRATDPSKTSDAPARMRTPPRPANHRSRS